LPQPATGYSLPPAATAGWAPAGGWGRVRSGRLSRWRSPLEHDSAETTSRWRWRPGSDAGASSAILVRQPAGDNAAQQVRMTATADATAKALTPHPMHLDSRMHSLARAT
jgi:hypothetical protein